MHRGTRFTHHFTESRELPPVREESRNRPCSLLASALYCATLYSSETGNKTGRLHFIQKSKCRTVHQISKD